MKVFLIHKINRILVILNGFAQGFPLWGIKGVRKASEESPNMLMFKILRFFAALRMTKKHDCHFEACLPARQGGTTEKSPENRPTAQEISPDGRNDSIGRKISSCVPCCATSLSRDDNITGPAWFFHPVRSKEKILSIRPGGLEKTRLDESQLLNNSIKLILFLLLLTFTFPIITSAQNIMQINNAQGVINSTVVVPISITNNEEFISFQCDVLLPDGFNYVAGSITLTPRSVDHVVNVTNTGSNTIRILSYSLNNTPFLLDSGIVANFNLTTPPTQGDYSIGINNGIIGNAESVNILDSIVVGEINLAPIGILENNLLEDSIRCFPVPFNENLTIQLDADFSQSVNIQVYNINGILLSNHKLGNKNTEINSFSFDTHSLLGNNPANGCYFIHFGFQDGNKEYSIVKKIQLNK